MASLRKHGYELTHDPKSADTLLFNTCSVREHAEDKTYSALGHLKKLKTKSPEKVIGVMGCMAQKDQQSIFERAPYVDLVVGPVNCSRFLIDLVVEDRGWEETPDGWSARRRARSTRSSGATRRSSHLHLRDRLMPQTPFQAYLRIQIGCDKFCTYCIVPSTRGPEQGRAPEQIYDEARVLADQGCKEIILLGQTVNSYKHVIARRQHERRGPPTCCSPFTIRSVSNASSS